jgi:molecular chaperone DnaJ
VVIHVRDHEFFKRNGEDLILDVPISFVQAALGDVLKIPLVGDEKGYEMEIPQGTQPGDVLKAEGKGMPALGDAGRRGDLYVRIQVKIPEKLTKQQRELLEAFAQTESTGLQDRQKRGKNFWNRITH